MAIVWTSELLDEMTKGFLCGYQFLVFGSCVQNLDAQALHAVEGPFDFRAC